MTEVASSGRGARRLVVAIDGPASSGKSSVGAAAARDLGYRFCDTGLLYRGLTALALRRGAGLSDASALVPLVDEVELAAEDGGRLSRVLVAGADVTGEVRSPEVERNVSEVSRVPEVRAALLARQRALAAPGGIVMAGRDIGTVVLPTADLKIFLDASAEERARRRAEERGLAPDSPEAGAILADLRRRDELDRNRPVAPLRAAADAQIVRTDGNEFGQTVEAVKAVILAAEIHATAEADAGEIGGSAADAAEQPADPGPPGAAGPMTPPAFQDRPDWVIRATDQFGRILFRAFARIEFHGLERLDGLDGPVLIVANHVSNADAPLIGSFLTPLLGRRIHWLGKQEALAWPVIGPLLARNAVIGIRRGAADVEAFRAAKRVLDEGHVLCVFPEGTRSPSGVLQGAKEGTTILALRTGARILPVGITGTRRVWPRGQKLPHPGRNRVVLRVGEPFRIAVTGSGAERRAGQVAATAQIMGRIAELLPAAQRGVYASLANGSERGSMR